MTILVYMLVGFIGLAVLECFFAPEGYEDETGFHYGREGDE